MSFIFISCNMKRGSFIYLKLYEPFLYIEIRQVHMNVYSTFLPHILQEPPKNHKVRHNLRRQWFLYVILVRICLLFYFIMFFNLIFISLLACSSHYIYLEILKNKARIKAARGFS